MRFLVASDGSNASQRAVQFALDLAIGSGASMTVVYSVEPAVHSQGGTESVQDLPDAEDRLIQEDLEDTEARGERVLAGAARNVRDRGIEVETELLYGDPGDTIPSYAAEGEFDLLVVGHRGLSERAERVLGSVAKDLIEDSPVPVTVVS